MPTFEKGKGERKRSVTLTQLGSLLTRNEIEGSSERLTGYRQHESTTAAKAELLRASLELIADGLRPVDDAAREIARSIPQNGRRYDPEWVSK